MARERINDFYDLINVFEIEHCANKITLKIRALLDSLYLYKIADLSYSAAALYCERRKYKNTSSKRLINSKMLLLKKCSCNSKEHWISAVMIGSLI
jgi:hypothetical protein